jgi:hypothetical protein
VDWIEACGSHGCVIEKARYYHVKFSEAAYLFRTRAMYYIGENNPRRSVYKQTYVQVIVSILS